MEHFRIITAALAISLFCGMLLALEAGRRVGARRRMSLGDGGSMGIGALEGSLFALLGLLIAFTYSGALSRLDTRRQLDIEEANAIGTAYLRLDLLPADAQAELRQMFRRYVETRIEVYRKLPDIAAAKRELARAVAMQGEIWNRAVTASRQSETTVPAILLLPALNAMIDITATQAMTAELHPPMIIHAMLYALALISALLAGYDMALSKDRHWMHVLCFAFALTLAFYVVLHLEYPRQGFIRIDAFNQALLDVLKSMK